MCLQDGNVITLLMWLGVNSHRRATSHLPRLHHLLRQTVTPRVPTHPARACFSRTPATAPPAPRRLPIPPRRAAPDLVRPLVQLEAEQVGLLTQVEAMDGDAVGE